MRTRRCPLCACHHVPKCQATARTSQWAIEPLLAIAGRDTVHAWCGERSTKKVIAAGGLSDVQADRWATRLGYHPVQIWGAEWVDAALRPIDEIHAREGWRPAWLDANDTPTTTQEPAA